MIKREMVDDKKKLTLDEWIISKDYNCEIRSPKIGVFSAIGLYFIIMLSDALYEENYLFYWYEYGILLLTGLFLIYLVVYNLSDKKIKINNDLRKNYLIEYEYYLNKIASHKEGLKKINKYNKK